MPETNESKSIPSFITMLVLLLVAVVGIQTWYMVKMQRTLDTIQSEQSSSLPPEQQAAETNAKLATKKPVTPAEEKTAIDQGEPVIQEIPAEKKNLNPDNPAPLAPDASAPPALADDFFNSPPYMQTWDPYEEMRRMQQQMERRFNDRYNTPYYNRPDYRYRFQQNISAPEMDMREDRDRYIVLVNIPGTDQKDISVTLEGQRLTVMGKQEYKNQDRDANGNIIFSERRSGKFKRSITLHEPVEKKGMKNQIDNGVLRIMIPKKK